MEIVVATNVSLDGVVQDPDGQEGFKHGGWFRQFGGKDLEAWAGVMTAEALDADALLLGRRATTGSRESMAGSQRRMGRPIEQPAEVRRVLHPQQADGPTRPCSKTTSSKRSPR